MASLSSEALRLAVDTTLVSPLHGGGSPHRGVAERDGVALVAAKRRKERTNPELMAPRSRASLVLAMEVGGTWSSEALTFVRLLAKAKAKQGPHLMRKRVEQAWRMRWCSLLGWALATSLLELRGSGSADGAVPPSHEVEGDHWHSGLSAG